MIAVLASTIFLATPATIYVSPSGNDKNAGTQASPVATLVEAQTRLRSLRQDNTNTPGTIILEAGAYYITKELKLDTPDSNLTIEGNGDVQLFGGSQITGWQNLGSDPFAQTFPAQAASSILVADLNSQIPSATLKKLESATTLPTINFLSNGTRYSLPRYPNAGSWMETAPGSGDRTYVWNDPTPGQWSASDQLWCSAYPEYDWNYSLNQLEPINAANMSAKAIEKVSYGIAPGSRMSFINVPEELNKAGEWYLNRATGKLYYWPVVSGQNTTLTTVTNPIISGMNGVENVTIQNLDFEGGRNTAISFTDSSNITIQGCTVNGFAVDGIDFVNSFGCTVEACSITNTGNTGVLMNGGSVTTVDSGNVVSDCTITGYGQWIETSTAGISLQGSGNTATHNLISNGPGQAILVSGSDETVNYNDIHDVCTDSTDCGAIYMGREPLGRGALIEGNLIYNVYPRVIGNAQSDPGVTEVYLDDMWPGATVRGNYLEGGDYGVQVGGGRDTTVTYNIFYNNATGIQMDARGIGWAESQATWGGSWDYLGAIQAAFTTSQSMLLAKYPPMSDALTNQPLFPVRGVLTNNVAVGKGTFANFTLLTQSQVQFKNNVSLSSGSVAAAVSALPSGYTMTPLSQIGPRS